ncbi:type II toxin-antitoxin system HicA family toxin [Rhodoferax sp. 4810]|uniref:Type II toxin-antitoxin system HicA family toxin n=1 Tax=Thiospirillum jenense TaxID=1653858 RepID=A0A839HDW1_9GAMM|nr:type II toxin-antitoxin system HicA family toxin [Thiospirillum jenense]MBB1074718.1 type II toxin-antitoxin system HicA family toxin [Rhodoferax jenense]MBB1125438.1 type II toxin-antitoxin system HicA family toxin [Thiospirillum jenense]
MTKYTKQLQSLKQHPHNVRFDDACHIAESLGFIRRGGKGSHQTYGKENEPILLNFQNRHGYIPTYQAKQLLIMVEKYAALFD